MPIVSVGAPVEAYFPEVAERLNSELILPRDADVANAVGTVKGVVRETIQILIKPGETGGYFVYTPEERKIFFGLDEALQYGETAGKKYARERVKEAGASRIEISVDRSDRYAAMSGAGDDEGDDRLYIETRITVSAWGKPWNE